MQSVNLTKSLIILGAVSLLVGCGQQVNQQGSPASTGSALDESGSSDEAQVQVLSDEDIFGIQDACLQVFQLDWRNVPADPTMRDIAREYTAIKNGAVRFGDEARIVIESVSDLVMQMDEANDLFTSDSAATISKFSLRSTSEELDQVQAEHEKNLEAFWASRDSISEQINQECQPYFD